MIIEDETISRKYIITEAEIKERLKIKGTIKEIILWEGLSFNDIDKGVSSDKVRWAIETSQSIGQEKKWKLKEKKDE